MKKNLRILFFLLLFLWASIVLITYYRFIPFDLLLIFNLFIKVLKDIRPMIFFKNLFWIFKALFLLSLIYFISLNMGYFILKRYKIDHDGSLQRILFSLGTGFIFLAFLVFIIGILGLFYNVIIISLLFILTIGALLIFFKEKKYILGNFSIKMERN
ncbi:hypothetical protein J7L48_09810, partial [bacterium]|nr:hypothetical protein [bacterium]